MTDTAEAPANVAELAEQIDSAFVEIVKSRREPVLDHQGQPLERPDGSPVTRPLTPAMLDCAAAWCKYRLTEARRDDR